MWRPERHAPLERRRTANSTANEIIERLQPLVDADDVLSGRTDQSVSDPPQELTFALTHLEYGADFRYGTVLYAFGPTPSGKTVGVGLYGFYPYFYVEKPRDWTSQHVETFRCGLERELRRRNDYDVETGRHVLDSISSERRETYLNSRDPSDAEDTFKSRCYAVQRMWETRQKFMRGWKAPEANAVLDEKRAAEKAAMESYSDVFMPVNFTPHRDLLYKGRRSDAELNMMDAAATWVVQAREVSCQTVIEYQGPHSAKCYIKLHLLYPKMVAQCRRIVEDAIYGSSRAHWWPASLPSPQNTTTPLPKWIEKNAKDKSYGVTRSAEGRNSGYLLNIFEANIDFTSRFMIDRRIRPTWWLSVAVYERVSKASQEASVEHVRRLYTHHEAWTHYANLRICDAEKEQVAVRQLNGAVVSRSLRLLIPNVLCVNFDIEAESSRRGRFPNPLTDRVIQISMEFYRMGSYKKAKRFLIALVPPEDPRVAFTGAELESITCLTVLEESDILVKFRELMLATRVTVIGGYNSNAFDFWYLLVRARMLGYHDFPLLGALGEEDSRVYTMDGKSIRGRKSTTCKISGRVVTDYLRWALTPGPNKDFESANLAAVSEKILGETKLDMPPDMIGIFQRSAEGRRKLGLYCMKDSSLLRMIDEKRKVVLSYWQQSETMAALMQNCHDRGTEFVTTSIYMWEMNVGRDETCGRTPLDQLNARECTTKPYLIVSTKRQDDYIEMTTKNYSGGANLMPKLGYYKGYVLTIDFRSLYPSVMEEKNLCPLTMVRPSTMQRCGLTMDQVHIYPQTIEDPKSKRDLPMYNDETCEPLLKDFTLNPEEGFYCIKREVEEGVMPRLQRQWATKRKQLKAEMNSVIELIHATGGGFDDPQNAELVQRKELLDIAQNTQKLSMNSAYGFLGSTTSAIRVRGLAAFVCARGRELLYMQVRRVEKMFNCECVIYGDSVTVDTPILCWFAKTNTFGYRCIYEISDGVWFRRGDGKEESGAKEGVHVWTERGVTAIKRVICHGTAKRLMRVHTAMGVVDVTTDHSLLRPNGTKVTPNDVAPGTELMHAPLPTLERFELFPFDQAHTLGVAFSTNIGTERIPDALLNSDVTVRMAFFRPLRDLGEVTVANKLNAASIYFIAASLGHRVAIHLDKDFYRLCFDGATPTTTVQSVRDITHLYEANPTVYDLETENHHFNAGAGQMIVHNTDSIMVHDTQSKTLEEALENITKIAKYLNTFLPAPHSFNAEKISWNFNLQSRKVYSAMVYMIETKITSLSAKGLISERRGVLPFLSHLLRTSNTFIIEQNNIEGACEFVRDELRRFFSGDVPLDELVTSVALKKDIEEYETALNKHGKRIAPGAHVHVAKRMALADPDNAPRAGSRIQLVVCKTDTFSKGAGATKQIKGDMCREPFEVEANNLSIDYDYLFENCLKTPITSLFRGPLGSDEKVHEKLFWGPHMLVRRSTIRNNAPLLQFFAKDTLSHCDFCKVKIGVANRLRPGLPFCTTCGGEKLSEFITQSRAEIAELTVQETACWDQCNKCAGDIFDIEEIKACSSSDCSNRKRRGWVAAKLVRKREKLEVYKNVEVVKF